MERLTEQIVHDPTGLQKLESKYGGKHAQVYCTNGARLTGVVNFMPNKWIAVVKDEQHSALVNLDFVISIALETA